MPKVASETFSQEWFRRGPEGFRTIHRSFTAAFRGIHIEVIQEVHEGDLVAAFHGCPMIRLRRHQIVEAWNVWDFLTLAESVGESRRTVCKLLLHPCSEHRYEPLRVPEGLAIWVRGRGPDVILIHGALGDYRQWEPIGLVLSARYRVIAMSRRFHWPNPPPSGPVDYSFEKHSADLHELLRSLDRPVHLVGHSYGAGVALLTVLHHPELVRSLTLIEPPFGSLVPPSDSDFAAERTGRDSMIAALRVNVRAGSVERDGLGGRRARHVSSAAADDTT